MIDYSKLDEAVAASIKKAEELGIKVSVAVVDEHGSLLAFRKMEGAINASPKFSIAKAYTSANLGLASGDIAGYAGEGKPYFGINSISGGEFTPIAGGLPVKNGELLVGGIGVGGSTDVSQDVLCAQEGQKVLES